jgi:hypothetical protein
LLIEIELRQFSVDDTKRQPILVDGAHHVEIMMARLKP